MDQKVSIHFAPMQGYVDPAYRRLHASMYGGIDCYYTPFIRVEKGKPRRQDMRRLQESIGDGVTVVPQVIFNGVDELRVLTDALRQLGCKRIDMNLGCPFPMQTGRGRGAAMIANAQRLEDIARMIEADTEIRYSVKMRLGMQDPQEWRLAIPVLNSLELEHIVLHPRVARQQYAGELHHEQFAAFLAESSNPVIWNGDILSPEDIDSIIRRYPDISGVMIGRGMLGRPSLATEWRGGKQWEQSERLSRLIEMHSQLLAEYESTLCGQVQILQKIKPYWDYLEAEIGHKAYKSLHKANTLTRYKSAVDSLHQR